MNRSIRTVEDVLAMLDRLLDEDEPRRQAEPDSGNWWDEFYSDRERDVPFFVPKPDENLAAYLERGLIVPGRAVDLGCGTGRNAIHLAAQGFDVDAVDLSRVALTWASERASESGVQVAFHEASIFEAELPAGRFDLVYDSGCLHHLPPHRRPAYLDLIDHLLAPGGHYALACFAVGQMGSELPDVEFYRERSLQGGIAFSQEELRYIFAGLTEVEIRPMMAQSADSAAFGVPFLLTALFRHAGE